MLVISKFGFVTTLIAVLLSCSASQYCSESKKYIKKVDVSKPYWLEGTYCIQKEESRGSENCMVVLNVYDRISGLPIKQGTAFFTDSIKVEISSGTARVTIPPGNYNVGITSFNSLPFSIKDLNLAEPKLVEINCYLGSSLQF